MLTIKLTPEIKNHIIAAFWVIFAFVIGGIIYYFDKQKLYFTVYLGFLAALLVFSIVDYFRRPHFVICVGAINEHPEGQYRFVHVNVINLDWPTWFFLFRKDVAVNSTAEIIFREKDSKEILFSVPGRWSSNPEPIKIQGENTLLFDEEKARSGGIITISPSKNTSELREGKLGISIKYEGENEAFGFSDLSYTQRFKYQKWKLSRGVYDVTVRINNGRFSTSKNFVLENLGKHLDNFTLKAPNLAC